MAEGSGVATAASRWRLLPEGWGVAVGERKESSAALLWGVRGGVCDGACPAGGWFLRRWRSRWDARSNSSPHCWHLYTETWCRREWRLRWSARLNLFPQIWHKNILFSGSGCVRMWRWKRCCLVNLCPQTWQDTDTSFPSPFAAWLLLPMCEGLLERGRRWMKASRFLFMGYLRSSRLMNVQGGIVYASLSMLWSRRASIGVSSCRKSSALEKSISTSSITCSGWPTAACSWSLKCVEIVSAAEMEGSTILERGSGCST